MQILVVQIKFSDKQIENVKKKKRKKLWAQWAQILELEAQQEGEDMVSPPENGVSLFTSSFMLCRHFQQVKHRWIPVFSFLQAPVTSYLRLTHSCSSDRQVSDGHIRNSVGGRALGCSLPPRVDLQRTQPFFLQYPSQFFSLLHLFGIFSFGLWECTYIFKKILNVVDIMLLSDLV